GGAQDQREGEGCLHGWLLPSILVPTLCVGTHCPQSSFPRRAWARAEPWSQCTSPARNLRTSSASLAFSWANFGSSTRFFISCGSACSSKSIAPPPSYST